MAVKKVLVNNFFLLIYEKVSVQLFVSIVARSIERRIGLKWHLWDPYIFGNVFNSIFYFILFLFHPRCPVYLSHVILELPLYEKGKAHLYYIRLGRGLNSIKNRQQNIKKNTSKKSRKMHSVPIRN